MHMVVHLLMEGALKVGQMEPKKHVPFLRIRWVSGASFASLHINVLSPIEALEDRGWGGSNILRDVYVAQDRVIGNLELSF